MASITAEANKANIDLQKIFAEKDLEIAIERLPYEDDSHTRQDMRDIQDELEEVEAQIQAAIADGATVKFIR